MGQGADRRSFELIDHTGKPRTDADFRDKLMLVYFGFTFCPDVCPTDLLAMGLAVDRLGSAGEAVQPLFITVDPERDTPDAARRICAIFSSATDRADRHAAQIRKAASAYRAYFAKVAISGGNEYTVDHSGFIYLMDRGGKYLGFFPPGTSAEQMAQVIRPHLPAPEPR